MSKKERGNATAVLLALAIIAAIAIRIYPLGLCSYQDPDHYYHERQIQAFIDTGKIPTFDQLSNMGRRYTYYPAFHLLGAELALAMGVDAKTAYEAVSLLAVALSMLAVFAAAKKSLNLLGLEENYAYFAIVIAAAGPVFFVRQTVFSRPDAFAPAIYSLLFWAALSHKPIVALVVGAFAALLHPYSFAVIAALVAVALAADWLAVLKTGKRGAFFDAAEVKRTNAFSNPSFVALLFFAIAGLATASYYLSLPLDLLSIKRTFLTSSEMMPADAVGALQYLGIALVFGFLGIYEGIRAKSRIAFIAAPFLVSAAFLSVANRNIVFASAPAAILAAAGFCYACRRSGKYAGWLWALALAAVAIVAFAAVAKQSAQYAPQQVAGFAYLGRTDCKGVFALWDRGHAITAIAKKPVVMDGYFEFEPTLDERVEDIAVLLSASDKAAAFGIATKYGADCVFYDGKTRGFYGQDNNTVFNAADSSPSKGIDKIFDSGDAKIFRMKSNAIVAAS